MTQSKAIYYEQTGPAHDVLKMGIFDIPDPMDGEVQVEMILSGINPSDVKMRSGQRDNKIMTKMIPHSDGAGIVKHLGTSVTRFQIGDRVWIYNAAWNRSFGTACTLVNLPENLLQKLPENTSFERGACLGIPALTAASCLLSLNCQKGDMVMITGGAGAVGSFAIQLAKFLDLIVITTVSSEEKEAIALAAGADYTINYRSENVIEKIKFYTQNQMIDGLIDVDFGENLKWSIEALKDHATIATYASSTHPYPTLPFYPLMFKQITLKPIFVYNLENTLRQKSLDLIQNALKNNILNPLINKIYPLEQAAQAHIDVESSQKMGHVLLKCSDH